MSGQRRAKGGESTAAGGGQGGILRFYSEEGSNGIKIGPNTVLVMSLTFIGLVVMMHVVGKLRT
jgi:protein transport protein SEC61 subunit beta